MWTVNAASCFHYLNIGKSQKLSYPKVSSIAIVRHNGRCMKTEQQSVVLSSDRRHFTFS